jgi:hypothetical protein
MEIFTQLNEIKKKLNKMEQEINHHIDFTNKFKSGVAYALGTTSIIYGGYELYQGRNPLKVITILGALTGAEIVVMNYLLT